MKLTAIFNELMRKHHRQAVLLGSAISPTAEEFFGFHHWHVSTVHFHKQGVGEGSMTLGRRHRWFRLRCGRVVDDVARPCPRDPGLYDYGAKWSYT